MEKKYAVGAVIGREMALAEFALAYAYTMDDEVYERMTE